MRIIIIKIIMSIIVNNSNINYDSNDEKEQYNKDNDYFNELISNHYYNNLVFALVLKRKHIIINLTES